MARIDDLLRAESMGLLDRIQGGAADLERARAGGLTPAPEDDYPEIELTPEQQELAAQGEATREAGGLEMDPEVRKAEALQAEPAWKRAAAAYGGSMYDTLRGAQQLAGVDLSPEQEKEVRAQRELWKSGGAAGKGGKIAGNVAQMLVPGKAAEVGLRALPTAAKLAASGAVIGGAEAGLQPVLDDESRGRNVLTGATVGGATGGALGAVGAAAKRLTRPVTPSAAAEEMMSRGVQPTTGQGGSGMVGKGFSTLENTMRLLTGSGLRRGRQEATEDLLRLANPLDDAPVSAVGAKDMGGVFKQLQANTRQAYSMADSLSTEVAAKGSVANSMGKAIQRLSTAEGIPPSKMKPVNNFLKEKFGELPDNLTLSDFRKLRNAVRKEGWKYKGRGVNDPDSAAVSRALNKVQENMTAEITERYGAAAAKEIKRVDGKYHLYKIFERAKNSAKGKLTPESLRASIKKSTSDADFAAEVGTLQPELAQLTKIMPALEEGAWGGLALSTALTGGSAIPAALLSSSRIGSKALLGNTAAQRAARTGMESIGRATQGLPSAVAASQGMISDIEE